MVKRSKQYKQMMKKWKKKILKDAKDASTSPWDYGFGLDMFVDYIYFMRDYYALGENVWQAEESHNEVKDSLNRAINEYEEWQNCHEKYIKIIHKSEDDYEKQLKHWLRLGYHLKEEKEDNKNDILKDVSVLYFYEDIRKTYDEMRDEYIKHRDNFFRLVSDNIENWWD